MRVAVALVVSISFCVSHGDATAQNCTVFGPPKATSEFMFGTMIRRIIGVTFTMQAGTLGCTGVPTGGSITANGAICSQFVSTLKSLNNCASSLTGCYALAAFITISAYGGDPTMAGPHSCNWNCGVCGSFTINESDGLPVELIDFTIEAN